MVGFSIYWCVLCVVGVKLFPGNSARDRGELVESPHWGGTSWAAPVSGNADSAAAVMPGTFWGTFYQTRKWSNGTRLQVRHCHQMPWINKYRHSCGRAVLEAGETNWNDDKPTELCLESRAIISLNFSGLFQCFFRASLYLTNTSTSLQLWTNSFKLNLWSTNCAKLLKFETKRK